MPYQQITGRELTKNILANQYKDVAGARRAVGRANGLTKHERLALQNIINRHFKVKPKLVPMKHRHKKAPPPSPPSTSVAHFPTSSITFGVTLGQLVEQCENAKLWLELLDVVANGRFTLEEVTDAVRLALIRKDAKHAA